MSQCGKILVSWHHEDVAAHSVSLDLVLGRRCQVSIYNAAVFLKELLCVQAELLLWFGGIVLVQSRNLFVTLLQTVLVQSRHLLVTLL